MKSKALLVILLFIMWSVASGWYYICEIKQQCPTGATTAGVTSKEGLTFKYGESVPILSGDFEQYKMDLLNKMDSNNVLKIVGFYDPSEVNNSSFDNLGVARAIAVQNLFSNVDQSRFSISSEQVKLEDKNMELDAVDFIILTRNEFVQETDFGAIIFLDTENINPKIDAFLTYLAIENQGRSIDVVGHWDNSETSANNFSKALDIANTIVQQLADKGLDKQNLNPTSKGETEPIADNATIEGRAKNRRVEIILN